jgi:hypothetical protein
MHRPVDYFVPTDDQPAFGIPRVRVEHLVLLAVECLLMAQRE